MTTDNNGVCDLFGMKSWVTANPDLGVSCPITAANGPMLALYGPDIF